MWTDKPLQAYMNLLFFLRNCDEQMSTLRTRNFFFLPLRLPAGLSGGRGGERPVSEVSQFTINYDILCQGKNIGRRRRRRRGFLSLSPLLMERRCLCSPRWGKKREETRVVANKEREQRGVCLYNKHPRHPYDTPVTILEIKGVKEKRGVENNGGEYGE